MFDAEIDDAFRELSAQWNIAERRIKKAELVRANNVVSSAIFELRYAGRKLVDALNILHSDEWKSNSAQRQRILRYLADATEDCVKAKHDAIDATLLFITSWIERTENAIGLSELVKYFPNYIDITGKISNIQDRIADSRADRSLLRDSIYDEIERSEYTEILNLYSTMASAESRVLAQIRFEEEQKLTAQRRLESSDRTARRGTAAGVAGAVAAIVAVILTAVTMYLAGLNAGH